MSATRLIAFRFDRNPMVCRARVEMLRRFNPGVAVHGLYGGGAGYRGAAFRAGGKRLLRLDGLYVSRRSGRWNWKNGDLVLLDWFRDIGHRLVFDVVHFIEWDLLLLDPLDRLYASVPPDAVGLTAYTPVAEIGNAWRWVHEPVERQEWEQLLGYARARFGYDGTQHGCLGVGPCFPRSFLADYAAANPPDLGNDELRLPLFAELLGYAVADTGFRRRWHDPDEDQFFNATGRPVAPETVTAELAKPDGRRAFHPVSAAMRDLARTRGVSK